MPTTTNPLEDRVLAQMAAARTDLDARIAEALDREGEQLSAYGASLDRTGQLSKQVLAADDAASLTPELRDELNAEHEKCIKAMTRAQNIAAAIRVLREKRAVLDQPEEFTRRMETAQRLDALRGGSKKGGNRRAAIVVLLDVEGNKGLHYKTITERAISAGLVATEGKTPDATFNAMLSVAAKKGETFSKVTAGVFALIDPDKARAEVAEPEAPAEAKADEVVAQEPAKAKPRAPRKPAAKAATKPPRKS